MTGGTVHNDIHHRNKEEEDQDLLPQDLPPCILRLLPDHLRVDDHRQVCLPPDREDGDLAGAVGGAEGASADICSLQVSEPCSS